MSANLIITARVDDQFRVGTIPRILRGITHSATVGRGDFIDLPGAVTVEVVKVVHGWQPSNSERAPASVIFGSPTEDLTAEQWSVLQANGMEETG